MEVGELMGPIETPDGWSIFKLIDKKEQSTNSDEKTFDEIRNELKSEIRVQKLSEKFVDTTAELASKYGVSIDSNLLESTKVSDLSMFVYRYFGFGGRLTAVPVTNPFTEWVEKMETKHKRITIKF
jgi:predicted nucleic acid-binding protein